MISFCRIKMARGGNLGHNGLSRKVTLVECLLFVDSLLFLFMVLIKNSRTILAANIWPLTIYSRRIVYFPEDVK